MKWLSSHLKYETHVKSNYQQNLTAFMFKGNVQGYPQPMQDCRTGTQRRVARLHEV